MPSVAFFRLTARSVLCVWMERKSLPTVPGTDNSHNRRISIWRSCPSCHSSSSNSVLPALLAVTAAKLLIDVSVPKAR